MRPRFRLKRHVRAFVIVAGQMARFGFKLPHSLVSAVVRRGWQMQTPHGWVPIRLDSQNRVVFK